MELSTSRDGASSADDQASTSLERHFQLLDDAQFLFTGARDRHGLPLVLIVGRNLDPAAVPHDALLQYYMERTQEAAGEPYRLIYVHTQASLWGNSPGMRWLWQAYHHRMQGQLRSNLARVTVVHADLALRSTMWLLCPWAQDSLWEKVEFVPRIEFLWEDVDKQQLQGVLPDFELQHDTQLEGQPLMDYGLVVDRDRAVDTLGLAALGRA